MTTQEFVESAANRELGEIGMLFVDGYHSADQVRFDYQAFADRIAPHGLVLFHDSMLVRTSTIYGAERAYETSVAHMMSELREDPSLELFDLPFGTGLTLLRKRTPESAVPRLEGEEARPA
jgi:predicted O-methyltransferase YrrM